MDSSTIFVNSTFSSFIGDLSSMVLHSLPKILLVVVLLFGTFLVWKIMAWIFDDSIYEKAQHDIDEFDRLSRR